MNIQQLQQILSEYTDEWINSQPQAERAALRLERDDLEAELALKLSQLIRPLSGTDAHVWRAV